MALDATKVKVATTGAAYIAPTTLTAPTSASSALGTDAKDLGYISDGGITETRDRSTSDIRAWQNGALVRQPVTESSITFNFVLIETKKEVIEAFYGGSVATDGSIKINPAKTGGRKTFIFDVIDGDEIIRIYVPSGEITSVGDQVYVNGDPIGYELTVTGYLITSGSESYSAIKWYASLAPKV